MVFIVVTSSVLFNSVKSTTVCVKKIFVIIKHFNHYAVQRCYLCKY